MTPIFFENQYNFRKWLSKNHKKEKEIFVGYYKVTSGKPSMTWSQSVDEAISYGWIDGIRRSIDKESYTIRFTPRNPNSIWSALNTKKAEELIRLGLMQNEGLKLFENRKVEKSSVYSYENKPETLPTEFELLFKKNNKSWEFFSKQSTSYKRTIYFWILSAKQESTMFSRLNKIIDLSEQQLRYF